MAYYTLNALAVARQHLGCSRGSSASFVSVATSGDFREQPKVADAASELLQTSSERTRALVASCMESQAFRSAPRSSWK